MYLTVLRLIWPYVLRYVTSYGADYLQKRRERRLGLVVDAERPENCPPCPPCPPTDSPESVETDPYPAAVQASRSNPIWYALSGLVLGCAFSVIIYIVVQDEDGRP